MARSSGTKLIAENRRARHDYELLDRYEAGVVLTELKADEENLERLFFRVTGQETPVNV